MSLDKKYNLRGRNDLDTKMNMTGGEDKREGEGLESGRRGNDYLYKESSAQKDTGKMGLSIIRRTAGWGVRIVVAAVIAVAVAALPFEVFSEKGFSHYKKLTRELAALSKSNNALEEDIFKLEREISDLRDDDFSLERVARDELGMIREGEIVFIVEERDWP
jgi:cell division protein FtsB